jgi:hypothetical protein
MPADLPVILVPGLLCAVRGSMRDSLSNLARVRRASAKVIMSRPDSRPLLVNATLAVMARALVTKAIVQGFPVFIPLR